MTDDAIRDSRGTGEACVPSADHSLGPTADGSAFDTWKGRMGMLYDIRLPAGVAPEDFTVRGRTWQLPSAILSMAARSPVELRRTADFIAENPVDNLCLYFAKAGTVTANCGSGDFALRTGDILMMDFSNPVFTAADEAYANVTLLFTRFAGPALFRSGRLHGALLRADNPGARLLHAQLAALLEGIGELPVRMADAALVSMMSLAALSMDRTGQRSSQTADVIVDRAVAAIRGRIGDATLTPAAIALELGVSRTKLYRLLEPYGGVRNLIKRVRLDESLKTLAGMPPDDADIAQISRHHGFATVVQFNRMFQQRFGRTPRGILELRVNHPKAQLYRAWVEARRRQADFETIDAWLMSVTE